MNKKDLVTIKKELIKITSKEILMSFLDVGVTFYGLFDKGRMYRKSINKYFTKRGMDKQCLSQKIYYLKKAGLINTYVENKEKYIELTEKGKEKLGWEMIGKNIKRSRWDGKFRMVIFDVPEEEHRTRDVIRDKLYEIGFLQVQKSVFVYPFECKKDIDAISYYCSAKKYIVYLIADIIEGEEKIIDIFLERGLLKLSDLNKK